VQPGRVERDRLRELIYSCRFHARVDGDRDFCPVPDPDTYRSLTIVLFTQSRPVHWPTAPPPRRGPEVISIEDIRWAAADIKTVQPFVLRRWANDGLRSGL